MQNTGILAISMLNFRNGDGAATIEPGSRESNRRAHLGMYLFRSSSLCIGESSAANRGDEVLASASGTQTVPLIADQSRSPGWSPIEYALDTSDGTGHGGEDVRWQVRLYVEESLIRRRTWFDRGEWVPADEIRDLEEVIWPTWPGASAGPAACSASPLEDVRDYWSAAGARLRDSAKWMAAVLGAALATLVGTSPLSGKQQHPPPPFAIVIGAVGLALLGCTMFLVLQVMRPRSISFTDVQISDESHRRILRNPLRRWKETVESQQDLYLPCGVQSLTDLRRAMIIEEVTLFALSCGINAAQGDHGKVKMLCHTRSARAARLHELRDAAALVATVGEYYHLRYRSAWATYGGILCGLAGAAAVVAAFAWPS